MRNLLSVAVLLGGACLTSRPAAAQTIPSGVFMTEFGYQTVYNRFQHPTRLDADNNFTVGQPMFRFRGYNPKSLVLAEMSGIVSGTYGLIAKRTSPGKLSSGQVSGTGTYGQDQDYASLLIAKGSEHLKLGAEVVFDQFGLYQADATATGISPGVIASGAETLLGINLHYTSELGHRSYFRFGLYGDRIFHEGGIRGYAATADASLIVNLVGPLNLVAEARGRERFYAGQHTGTPSAYTNDPLLLDGLSAPENLPVRVMTGSFTIGLALGTGY